MSLRVSALFVFLSVWYSVGAMKSCEEISVDMCHGIGYSLTAMPNLVGHQTQADADFTLQTFLPLLQYGCSAQLNFFLCSVYVPMCNDKVPTLIGPCRGLCESVRSRCYPVLQGFGFPWPAALDCSKFPVENNHEHMCMKGPGEMGLAEPSFGSTNPVPCPDEFVYMKRTAQCAQLCDADVMFDKADKHLAQVWITVWAGLCFATSLFAVFTSLLDSAPRDYPYPLTFLVLCYNVVSVGWCVRAAVGRNDVACHPDPENPSNLLLSQGGLGSANCVFLFILIYYFGNAAAVWWIVLAVCWFLCSALSWSPDRLLRYMSVFHLFSWGMPATQTIAVLLLRYVDADELTGACLVGNQNSGAFLRFVIIPQFFYLILTAALVVLGLMSKQKSCASCQWKIGFLIFLYIIAATCTVASNTYEFWNREQWLLSPQLLPRTSSSTLLWLSLFRLFAFLILGVVVSVFGCSPKSLKAWKLLFEPHSSHKKQTQFQHNHHIGHFKNTQRIQRHRTHMNTKGSETLV